MNGGAIPLFPQPQHIPIIRDVILGLVPRIC
jgi:hypothetical protein